MPPYDFFHLGACLVVPEKELQLCRVHRKIYLHLDQDLQVLIGNKEGEESFVLFVYFEHDLQKQCRY